MKYILENYWSQIVVIIGAIGFFTQKLFELSIKKKEIRFSRLQENKILEIKKFYKSYQELRISLEDFLHETEYGALNSDSLKSIKQNIREKFVHFEYDSMTIKLFLNDDDIKIIDQIVEIFKTSRYDIARWHIWQKSNNPPEEYDKLEEIAKERFPKQLPELINKIESSLRNSFKSYL